MKVSSHIKISDIDFIFNSVTCTRKTKILLAFHSVKVHLNIPVTNLLNVYKKVKKTAEENIKEKLNDFHFSFLIFHSSRTSRHLGSLSPGDGHKANPTYFSYLFLHTRATKLKATEV